MDDWQRDKLETRRRRETEVVRPKKNTSSLHLARTSLEYPEFLCTARYKLARMMEFHGSWPEAREEYALWKNGSLILEGYDAVFGFCCPEAVKTAKRTENAAEALGMPLVARMIGHEEFSVEHLLLSELNSDQWSVVDSLVGHVADRSDLVALGGSGVYATIPARELH